MFKPITSFLRFFLIIKLTVCSFNLTVYCQKDSNKTCSYYIGEYNNTKSQRDSLYKLGKKAAIDSILLYYIDNLNQICPCSYKVAQMTRLYSHSFFYNFNNQKERTFEILRKKFEECKSANDTASIFLKGSMAVYHLRNNQFFEMKRALDDAIEIGEKKFQPEFKELFNARCNLGLYYNWKRDTKNALLVHIKNEEGIVNKVFKDTSLRILNLGYIQDIASSIGDEVTFEKYNERLISLVRGTKFEKDVSTNSNLIYFDFYMRKGDLEKAEFYFQKIDATVFEDYILAIPLIRHMIKKGLKDDALKKTLVLDSILNSNKVPEHHLARVNVALEKLNLIGIEGESIENLSKSIHNNYKNLINTSPVDQHQGIEICTDNYFRSIQTLIINSKKEFIPLVYDRLHNLKNASNSYYTQLSRFLGQSSDSLLLENYNVYRRLCRSLKDGSEKDSLSLVTNKIQNRINDYGLKWDNDHQLVEIQNKIKPSEVFLDFYQTEKIDGKEYLYLFLVSKDKLEFLKYDNFLDTLAKQNSESNYSNNGKKNKALYDYLLKPLEQFLEGKQKIYLSTDGILNQIALDILSPSGKSNQLFGDKFELMYIENSKFLLESQNIPEATNKYFLSGGIQYDCTVEQNILASNSDKLQHVRSEFQYLEGSKKEVDILSKKLTNKSINYRILGGCDATKNNITLQLEAKDISNVHISTHGIVDQTQGEDNYFVNNSQSQLLLAKTNAKDDARLSAIEIINQDHRNKRLVFLSACNTGLGSYMSGFGNSSVGNAFKKAGAYQVVTTLWPIPDDVTALLCDYFYEHYITSKDANAALKYAQNELRKQKFSPENWAAFRVMN